MTLANIKTAILQCIGPVCTHISMRNGWRFLRTLTSGQFLAVAKELEASKLGRVVSVHKKGKGKPCHVFIKNPPSEVVFILKRPELRTTFGLYKTQYQHPIPNSIQPHIKEQLHDWGVIFMKDS